MSSGLLAGIGLTRLRVYDQRPAPDGTLERLRPCARLHRRGVLRDRRHG